MPSHHSFDAMTLRKDSKGKAIIEDEPPSVAQGVVVAGCPACRKRINTMTQFLDHLTNDALPALIGQSSELA
jgi:hypothetical protein